MKKHFLFFPILFIHLFGIFSCIPNFLKNNDSTPTGYEKINFSPKYSPSEIIRDALDQSNPMLLSLNNIFPNYSLNIIQNMDRYLKLNNNINSILNENSFTQYIKTFPSFPSLISINNTINSLETSSFIKNVTPIDKNILNYQNDKNNIFTKITGAPSKVSTLNNIQFFDLNGNIIDNSNINAKYIINTFYAINFYPSWVFSLNNPNSVASSWEFMVQCVSANVTIKGDSNTYTLPPWPRITIVLLNPNTSNTNEFVLIKNSLVFNNISTPTFIPLGNIHQKTLRTYNINATGLAPQSILYNSISQIQNPSSQLAEENYSYFQDGMSSFFARFSSANLIQNQIINTFASWQILVNKSWFDITRPLSEMNNTPSLIPISYLNYQNVPVNNNYSNDFKLGGIHYINPASPNDILLQVPNSLNASSVGMDENSLNNICNIILK